MSDTNQSNQRDGSPNDADHLDYIRHQIYDLIMKANEEGWDISYNAVEAFSQEIHTSYNQSHRMRLILEDPEPRDRTGDMDAEQVEGYWALIIRRTSALHRARRRLREQETEGRERELREGEYVAIEEQESDTEVQDREESDIEDQDREEVDNEEVEIAPPSTPGETPMYPEDYNLILPENERIQFNLSNRETMLRLLREDTQAYDKRRDDELWNECS